MPSEGCRKKETARPKRTERWLDERCAEASRWLARRTLGLAHRHGEANSRDIERGRHDEQSREPAGVDQDIARSAAHRHRQKARHAEDANSFDAPTDGDEVCRNGEERSEDR